MTTLKKSFSDRRAHHRVTIANCMFNANLKIGRVIDISLGGISFYYADRQSWPEQQTSTGTLYFEAAPPLEELPLLTVFDLELPNNYTPGSMVIHRRSMRFGALSPIQKEILTTLLKEIPPM